MPTQRPWLSTRDRILSYLEINRIADIPTLSQQWGMTPADIRYHINNLLREGIIEREPNFGQNNSQRGRPVRYYRLISNSTGIVYQELCSSLLSTLLRDLQTPDNNPISLLAKKLAPDPLPPSSLPQKITRLVDWLNERGYHSNWEAAVFGPKIKLLRCPYAAFLPNYPELCQLDQLILERLLQFPVTQISRINLHSRHPNACIYTSHLAAQIPNDLNLKNLKVL